MRTRMEPQIEAERPHAIGTDEECEGEAYSKRKEKPR